MTEFPDTYRRFWVLTTMNKTPFLKTKKLLSGTKGLTYLLPGVRLDLRKLELSVVGVHLTYLLTSRGAQHLDDLHQLVYTWISREDGLT